MAATTFYIRFVGGPLDGDVQVEGPWPPPEVWPDERPGGRYEATSMSKLTDEQANHPNLSRGVVYEWRQAPRPHHG